jgi:hypothetical protein
MKKIIDISGFGHSGKTAVTDLLREVDGLNVHPSSFEFNFLKLPDGLIDLKRNIIDNWSPIKSDFVIKRLKRLATALNANYSEHLGIDFFYITNEFINSIIADNLKVDWYDDLYLDKNQVNKDRIRKILETAGLLKYFRNIRKVYFSHNDSRKSIVYLVNQEKLILNIKMYLEKILFDKKNNDKTVVLNNAFGPFNPTESMTFFDNGYCVIVDRDPRDIYMSSLDLDEIYIPQFESNNPVYSSEYLMNLKRDMLGTNDIDTFILRQIQYRKNIKQGLDNDHVIRINYEDIVYKYEETVSLLFEKLGIDPRLHTRKLMHFNPELSKKNIGLWKRNSDMKEIKLISKKLKMFLYE